MSTIFDCFQDDDNEGSGIVAPMNFPGNKVLSMEHLRKLIPYDKKYIEAFGGSASLLLDRSPSPLEVYNDRHAGFVAFYKCIQDADLLNQMKEAIELMPHAREFFNWCRSTYEKDPVVLRGAKWYYMVQSSFGCRGDSWGFVTKSTSNVMNKIQKHIPYFLTIHKRFKNVQVENLDWRELFERYDDYDVVWYLDPPYYGTDTYDFNMTRKDHHELCERIFDLKGFVALSGYANDLYDQFPWDGIHSWEIDNKISVDFDNRGKVSEYLWIKEYEE